MAARGSDSLTQAQRTRVKNQAEVQYLGVLKPLSSAQFVQVAKDFDYLAITRRAIERLDQSVLKKLPRLKGISVYSTGTEWIDTAYLESRGIQLASLPDYCTNAVVESALGLLFLSAHKLHLRYLKTIHAVPEFVSLRGRELQSGTVGIIGYGRIGQLLAQKVQTLCKRVLVCDSNPEKLRKTPAGVYPVEQKRLLRASDWIVCCAAQGFEEKSIFSAADYALLRPQTILINVARSSLFDHKHLIHMVQNQELGAYYFDDVWSSETTPDAIEYGKIVPMGHTAWYTDEAMAAGTANWISNVCQLLSQSPQGYKAQIMSC